MSLRKLPKILGKLERHHDKKEKFDASLEKLERLVTQLQHPTDLQHIDREIAACLGKIELRCGNPTADCCRKLGRVKEIGLTQLARIRLLARLEQRKLELPNSLALTLERKWQRLPFHLNSGFEEVLLDQLVAAAKSADYGRVKKLVGQEQADRALIAGVDEQLIRQDPAIDPIMDSIVDVLKGVHPEVIQFVEENTDDWPSSEIPLVNLLSRGLRYQSDPRNEVLADRLRARTRLLALRIPTLPSLSNRAAGHLLRVCEEAAVRSPPLLICCAESLLQSGSAEDERRSHAAQAFQWALEACEDEGMRFKVCQAAEALDSRECIASLMVSARHMDDAVSGRLTHLSAADAAAGAAGAAAAAARAPVHELDQWRDLEPFVLTCGSHLIRHQQVELLRHRVAAGCQYELHAELTSQSRQAFEESVLDHIDERSFSGLTVARYDGDHRLVYGRVEKGRDQGSIRVDGDFYYRGIRLNIPELGSLFVGTDPENTTYRRLTLVLDEADEISVPAALEQFHRLTVKAGLFSLLAPPTQQDREWLHRRLILWRRSPQDYEEIREEVHFPRAWREVDDDMRRDIEILQRELRLQRVAPSRCEWVSDRLARHLIRRGLRGFLQSVNGDHRIAANFLFRGGLPIHERYSLGHRGIGASVHGDILRGADRSHFTRVITQSAIDAEVRFERLAVRGNFFILWSPTMAERIAAYGYNADRGGVRNRSYRGGILSEAADYAKRPSIHDIVEENQRRYNGANEVCFYGGSGPQYMVAIVCRSASKRTAMIAALQAALDERNLSLAELLERPVTLEEFVIEADSLGGTAGALQAAMPSMEDGSASDSESSSRSD